MPLAKAMYLGSRDGYVFGGSAFPTTVYLRIPRLLGGCMWRMQFALRLYWFGRRCGRAFFHDVVTFFKR